ncbi:GNAT family N-acetyltransferase [Moritella sp. 36]|uniref:GNAT family N-acetyltransferase n=1 Tax=Moritella sp. 36 TaxID=2746233 RepID=UPI001BA5C58F|nr:GNAT family N-acetyltransferase [Moritella sp. 36]QUM90497.1 GNAT family N-acetyltransferase [Moritella sp. 36]
MRIVEAKISDLARFFDYLGDQLTENGAEGEALFQPISRTQNNVSKQTREKFENGFDADLGSPNWRKLWLAKDSSGHICGHIDLRHHSEEYCFHRVLLGMGVSKKCRKQGVGEKMMEKVVGFCCENRSIDWLDLNVLSVNMPAKSLYLKCAFKVIGEISDYYRIEGESVSEITMTKCVKTYV